MAREFKGGVLIEEILEALDVATAKFVTNTQSKLSASSPVDTGRLASSWFVNVNKPSGKVPPEEPWASKKEGDPPTIKVERFGQRIEFGDDYYIDSNLPYTAQAAFDPGYVGRRGGGRGDWFTAIENNLGQDANRIFTSELRKLK